MDKLPIDDIQNIIGYKFNNKRLIEQAFVRRSYSKENPDFQDNETLEFYGDAALDYYVTRAMFKKFSDFTKDKQFISKKSEKELTELKSYNVNTEALSHCIWITGFQKYLRINKSDVKNNVQDSPSVMADLFEAIIGAVAVDCEWDFVNIVNVCRSMLKLLSFDLNYLEWLKVWCKEHSLNEPYFYPKFDYMSQQLFQPTMYSFETNTWYGRRKYEPFNSNQNSISGAHLYIRELNIRVESDLTDQYAAYMDCAKQAYKIIRDREMKESVGEPDYDSAVNQLNILYQKGFIKEPKYDFKEEHDEDGNPIWVCDCSLSELEDTYYEETPIKKESKKGAAYGALCALLGYDPEDD